MIRWAVAVLVFSLVAGLEAETPAATTWMPLLERLKADHFDERTLEALYSRPEVRFDPNPMVTKIRALLMSRFSGSPPRKHRPGRQAVYEGYLRADVIEGAQVYLQENRRTLGAIRKSYCVPEEIVVSIILIETHLGREMGKRSAFTVLSSMALARDFSLISHHFPQEFQGTKAAAYASQRCREKSDWAYNELKHLLRYAEASGRDPLSIPGSIYGAIGICQFMPSNLPRYGVDATGKGYVDPFSKEDALSSVANYLKKHGWSCRIGQKEKRRLIFAYNRDYRYVNTVLAVAQRLKYAQGPSRGKNGSGWAVDDGRT